MIAAGNLGGMDRRDLAGGGGVGSRGTAGRLPRLGWMTIVVLLAAGFLVIASRPVAPRTHPPTGDAALAEQAINDLLDPGSGRDPMDHLPADFTAVTGHVPVRMRAPDGTTRAVHPGGGCSSPWGDDDTRWDYSVGCKAHDLGYDLLRYADAKGQPLDPDLRKRLDDRLSADMHGMCVINPKDTPRLCQVVASLYSVGLVVNSWHQRWGPPRAEPIGPWSIGLIVIILLIAARMPALRAPPRRRQAPVPAPDLDGADQARSGYLGVLQAGSLAGIVLAESVLALVAWGPGQPGWVWPLTWVLQLVPLFFLAGGYANVLAWQAARGGFGEYLVARIGWLLRPVLAFVTAWLVVPLSLELFAAPPDATAAFGRIVLQPLWLLGLYLLMVAATPVMYRLHRRLPVLTPVLLLAAVVTIGLAGRGPVAAHAGGIVLALLFGQLGFHYADGTLWRVSRPALVAGAVAALAGLVALTTFGGQSRLLIAEPTAYASFVPSLLGVLLIGLVQTCLVALPQEPRIRAVAARGRALSPRLPRHAPMTAYLLYLCTMLLLAGLIAGARTASLTAGGADWLAQPRTMLALALVAAPTMLAFLIFERRRAVPEHPLVEVEPEPPEEAPLDALAAAIGVAYGALGLLGFAAAGITAAADPPAVLGLPLDPIANLIHLLLGWYLVHCVRIRTVTRPWPWLLTAIACVPPMITTMSGAGLAVHGLTMLLAIGIAASRSQPVLTLRTRSRAVTESTR
ncbi:acyltransferase family protein [Actinophytocola sp.]|uniref:acyltransferase family protein n=1 Tax=Actinophytocola sp. TaxID=1872138 RepID=UPI002D7EB9B6|nr:acyltransferase family protein [Actinophytocola sp.]HET9143249.1 acyltransferase family protein [Actinophytocola sp.]